MSDITYQEFKSELEKCAKAVDQASENLAAANKEYERTKAEFFEKQDTATPQERYDLGQDMHAARKEVDGCRAAQTSAREALSELVQAHPDYAKQTSEELGEGTGKAPEAASGNIGKGFAIAMVLTAALQEPAVILHEIQEDLKAHRVAVEQQVNSAEEAQQSPAAQEQSSAATPADHERDTGSQHHKTPHHEHLVWPELQPDMLEDEDEHRVVNEPAANDNAPPANDNAGPRVAANDNNPQPPDRPQAAAALPPLAVNESPQAARPPVYLEVVPPPPPPPPPPEPEADRNRSR